MLIGYWKPSVLAGGALWAAILLLGCANQKSPVAASSSRAVLRVATGTTGARGHSSSTGDGAAPHGSGPVTSGKSSQTASSTVGASPYPLMSVTMTSSSGGYAPAPARHGHPGTTAVLITSDGGASWKKIETIPYVGEDIVAPDADHAYLVAQCDGGCLRSVVVGTSNGGRSWTTLKTSAGSLSALSFVTDSEGWALSGDANPTPDPTGAYGAALLHTTDGGRTWTTLSDPCGKAGGTVSFVNPKDGWVSCFGQGAAGTSSKMVFRTQNGGRTWNAVATTGPGWSAGQSGLPLVGYVHDLFFLDPRDGWIGIDRGGYFATTDGGSTWHYVWSSAFPIGTDHAPSVGMLSSGFGWAVANNPNYGSDSDAVTALYTTENRGRSWRLVYPPPPERVQ